MKVYQQAEIFPSEPHDLLPLIPEDRDNSLAGLGAVGVMLWWAKLPFGGSTHFLSMGLSPTHSC